MEAKKVTDQTAPFGAVWSMTILFAHFFHVDVFEVSFFFSNFFFEFFGNFVISLSSKQLAICFNLFFCNWLELVEFYTFYI